MAREAGAKKMLIGDGNPIKQWYCKSCAAEHRVHLTGGQAAAIVAPLFERPPPSDLQTLDRRRVEAIKKRLP